MNDEKGKPLCHAVCQGRWAEVATYDDSPNRNRPQIARLLFKTAEESAEACRRLNAPWQGPGVPAFDYTHRD